MTRPPAGYIAPSGDVMVPPELAFILWRRAGLAVFRENVRGRRDDLDAVLEALRIAGERSAATSDTGTTRAEVAEVGRPWFTTTSAAAVTRYTDRWIRQLIANGKLEAVDTGGVWMIPAAEVQRLRRKRNR